MDEALRQSKHGAKLLAGIGTICRLSGCQAALLRRLPMLFGLYFHDAVSMRRVFVQCGAIGIDKRRCVMRERSADAINMLVPLSRDDGMA